jgi:hypothetical protein
MSSRASTAQKKRRREEHESVTHSVDPLGDGNTALNMDSDHGDSEEHDQLLSSPSPKPKKNPKASKTSAPKTKKAPPKKKAVSGKAANAASTEAASDGDSDAETSKKANRACILLHLILFSSPLWV